MIRMSSKRVVYQRKDCTWGWRLIGDNGSDIIAIGGEGYSNKADAKTMADKIINGHYKNAERFTNDPLPECPKPK